MNSNATPTAVYFQSAPGKWICEDVAVVTRPASPWTLRKVVTKSGKRFKSTDVNIVLVY